jgi:WD40 repeat protein
MYAPPPHPSPPQDKTIRVWGVKGPAGFQLLHTLAEAHAGWVWTVLLSPDDTTLFSGAGALC